jgi:BASS family bile acid:Na+ symporter
VKRIFGFIKDQALPVAMITGALTHTWVSRLSFATPWLIFAMLLVTFCKISLRDIRFHPVHAWLLLIQLIGSAGAYLLIRPFDETVAQGALLCIIAPTATAAAVITGMLGGNVGFLTAYVLFCNIAVAIVAPVYFTLAGIHGDMSFLQSVMTICSRVFPLLILPLFCAVAIRRFIPRVHAALLSVPRLTFYLWVVALVIVMGITVDFMLHQERANVKTIIALAVASLVVCCLQFIVGRRIGRKYGDPVSSGQGLGQKNTVLALWMAQTYFNPIVSIAPAAYIIWQNIINAYQLWMRNKKGAKKSIR